MEADELSAAEPPEILLVRPLPPEFHAVLSPRFRFLALWESPPPLAAFLASRASSVRVVLCSPNVQIDADLIDGLPSLELIVAISAGVNHIDLDACRRRSVRITNAGDTFTPDAADFAVGLLIDVLRRVTAADRYVRRGLWPVAGVFPLGSKVGGKRVGIVGLGRIGSGIAKRLEAFGCIISYNSRSKKPAVPYKYIPNVRDLAEESDVLVPSCALTPETRHIVDRDVMLAQGKDSIIINVGRGALIDEKELVRCLMEGAIGGAGLDVFENEPHVPEELFGMDNVVLSDHRAVITPESLEDLVGVIISNLENFFANRPLATPISY